MEHSCLYKPSGYTSVSPYLIVEDAQAALAFINHVFGVNPLFVHRGENGAILHAEVRIDDTVVMLGQMPGGPGAHVHVYVPDVESAFQRAKEAGGTVVQPPMEKGDGDRRGGVADQAGTTLWISTQMKERG
jgi:PhnB protein